MAVPRYQPPSSRAEADDGRPQNPALQRRQQQHRNPEPVDKSVNLTRQLFYRAQRAGLRPNDAARLVKQVQQEVSTMAGSSFAPGTEEYNQYFEERRKGTPRPEAFRKVLGFDPDEQPAARELQEGRKATEMPGGRKVFHADDRDVKAAAGGDVAKQRQATVNRQNGDEGGGSGRRSRGSDDDEDTGDGDTDSDIPDNWKDMPAAEVRSLAEDISGQKVSNRDEAEDIIEKELAKRNG